MTSSSKADMSTCSPDRPSFPCGQRGSHLVSHLDRSGSFCESVETQMLNTLPNMARSSSTASQLDIRKFFQCLRFDPKVVAQEHKSCRQGDFKRLIENALGVSSDDSTFSKGKLLASCIPEEIKRLKVGLRESTVKAKDRVKTFNEALSVFNKFFHSVPSKKRSRLEGLSGERSGSFLSNDKPVIVAGVGKVGIHNLALSGNTDFEQSKPGERVRHAVPNKRTRTSLVDNSTPNKMVTISDRDKEMPRPVNSCTGSVEERSTVPVGADSWEKTKLKKKRSGVKPDIPTSVPLAKPIDTYREPKPGIPPRIASDSRSKPSNESHIVRMGVSSNATTTGRPDSGVQPMVVSSRLSIPRTEFDSLANDRKERMTGSDKDRCSLKAMTKANVCDDFDPSSPNSCTKISGTVRAPRSGGGIGPKLSPTVHRVSAPSDWELSHCAKPTSLVINNRKRSASNRSLSPPVAHWTGQRPQKMSRTARRKNLVPILSSNDETAAFDTVSDASGNDIVLGLHKRMITNPSQQNRVKGEPCPNVLSESEESGAPEIKSKEKGKRSDEVEEKSAYNVQKLSAIGIAPKKGKLVSTDELGDGMKKGRGGRNFGSNRCVAPVGTDNFGTTGTGKQLRSGRAGFEKPESKIGRPTTRKLSDRKTYPRHRQATVNSAAGLYGASDDGNEELIAAASAVINSDQSPSNTFWQKMDIFFDFLRDDDIDFLKKQGTYELPFSLSSDVNECRNDYMVNGSVEEELLSETYCSEFSQQIVTGTRHISLFQRLLTALIPEEDCFQGCDDRKLDGYEIGLGLDASKRLDNLQYPGSIFNGHKPAGKCDKGTAIAIQEFSYLGPTSTVASGNGFVPDHIMIHKDYYSDLYYDDQDVNEKLKLEVQSIGIVIESMPSESIEDEEMFQEIKDLEFKIQRQVAKRKGLMIKLLNSTSDAKELQEKEFERRALDKLTTMAYDKYTACRGSHAIGGKSSVSKLAKQAASSFVKRTLDQCHRFEETGRSSFSERFFKDMFRANLSCRQVGVLDSPIDGRSSKVFVNSFGRSSDVKNTAFQFESQHGSRTSRNNLSAENGIANSPDAHPNSNLSSHKMKKRELLLDDVGGGPFINPSIAPSGGHLSSSTKGKRSERDRDGKGHNKEVGGRAGNNRNGRPAMSYTKGERKTKSKPKQKTAQLSVSVNGLVGKVSEHPISVLPPESISNDINCGTSSRDKDALALDVLNDFLIDDDGQGNDLGAWLNIEDDGLQDDDFMGLDIPMDDLSDLNMMV